MANIFTKFQEYLEAELDSRIDNLQKTEDLSKAVKPDGTIGRKGLLFDPFTDQATSAGFFKPRVSFLSTFILKQVSRRDPIVASIINVRASQVAAACKKQNDRFSVGFKLVPKDKTIEADPEEIRKIEEFILNCGYTENRTNEDKMTFDQWGYMVTRDFEVYGHAAIEKVRRGDGDLFAFLPISAENIYYASKEANKASLQGMIETWKKASDPNYDPSKDRSNEDYAYVQVIEGKVTEGFTEKELIFSRLNLESDIDLKGYAVGPLERAIAAITSHMQIENHQKQFFSHGTASKGVFVIQGDVTPNQLRTLQAQWNNQITGPVNAWRTPILAGIKGAEWINLTASNRDMEYAEYMRHILVTIFSCFAMDPEEAGFGFLSKGTEQRSLSESSNEWKIEASRDRGLRPLLGRIEAIINEDVLPEFNEELSKKYHFVFVGLDAETQPEELERLQAEVQLHTTLDEARKQAEMEPIQLGGGLILNPLLLQTLQMNLPKGVFMEKFMGMQGASDRPDLQYIPDPLWFQWAQMQLQMQQMQAGAAMQGGEEGGQEGPPQEGEEKAAPGEKKERKESNTPSPEEKAAQEEEMMQQQMEAQKMAVEQYIASNPELFKSMNEVLGKAEGFKKFRATHVTKLTNDLVKDFNEASNRMVKEILEVVKKDMDKGNK